MKFKKNIITIVNIILIALLIICSALFIAGNHEMNIIITVLILALLMVYCISNGR